VSKRKPAAPLVIQIWQTAGPPRESEGKFSAKWAKSKGSSKTDSRDDLKKRQAQFTGGIARAGPPELFGISVISYGAAVHWIDAAIGTSDY